jgi:hypothetical protein
MSAMVTARRLALGVLAVIAAAVTGGVLLTLATGMP